MVETTDAASTSPPVAASKPSGGMRALLRHARPALVVLLVAACAWALVSSWGDITDVLPRVGVVRYVVATIAAIVANLGLAVGWRILLFDSAHERLHGRIGQVESASVYSASQLGKYLPGSVWPVVAQMSLARKHDVPRRTILAAFVLQMLLLLLTAVLMAAVTLPWVDADQLRTRWWLLLAVPAVGVALVPSVQRRVLHLAGRVLRRDLGIKLPGARAMAGAVVASAVTYVCFGVHLALLAWPLSDAADWKVLLQATGAFALAWAAGFVVVFAPAGLGVRELVLKLTMGSVLLSADATAVAVLSRTSIVIADLVLGLAGIAVVSLNRRGEGRRRYRSAAESPG